MFGLRKAERSAYEAHIESLRKAERSAYEAHIESLRNEINWLRSCIPWVTSGSTAPAVGAQPPPDVAWTAVDEQDDNLPSIIDPLRPLSDEEEDVMDAYNKGDLDKEEAQAILKVLGSAVEIDFK